MSLLTPPNPVGTTIRFFISSTFSDFRTERNVLQQRVFPELRQLCATSGFRLQPIDLRWGVSEAASNNRQTLRICFDELDRCRQISPDFFLLILLGQRYGSYILPPELPSALVARLLPHLSPTERRAFEAAYWLDENAVPPEYVLLRADGPERTEDGELREMLARAARAADASAEETLLFTGSATHREIQLGLLDSQGSRPNGGGVLGAFRRFTNHQPIAPGVLCAVRTFKGHPQGVRADHFVERDGQRIKLMHRLTEAVLERLSKEQALQYEVAWQGDRGPDFNEDALAQRYLGLLRPKLEAVIAARTAARDALASTGHDAVALANAAFEQERAARVEGRELGLARITDYLDGKTGAGLPLVVTGVAGSGKSALLAEAAKRAGAAQPNATLIKRYIGVTPGAENLHKLLTDLRLVIAQAYGHPEPEPLLAEHELVSAVAALLTTLQTLPDRPLLLMLDAFDQLGANVQRTDWLPPHLAPHVRVVVSFLADCPELNVLRLRLPAEQVLTLAPLDRAAGQAMLEHLLAVAPQRTLTREQRDATLAAFDFQGLPLYLRLVASEARRWHSFDAPSHVAAMLPSTTSALLETILERLEAPERNGRTLVARFFGDLAAARFGLAEDELLDLLASDADVRKAQRRLSHDSPGIDPDLPLPVALWARLHAELKPLLSERTADGEPLYSFYYQQLRAVVEARYLTDAERVARHQALADYFARQPWRLGPNRWNRRKVRELVTQLERAGDRQAAGQALSELADDLEQPSHVQSDDPARILALVDALHDHLYFGGYWSASQRLLMRQLAAAREQGDRRDEGNTLLGVGSLASTLGRQAEAEHYYHEALAIFRDAGDSVSVGRTLSNLGNQAQEQGQTEDAERYYREALAIFRREGDRVGEGIALHNLASLNFGYGRTDDASRDFSQALTIFREMGIRVSEGRTLNNLGNLASEQGRLGDAERYYSEALAIRREMGDRIGEGTTLNSLANLAYMHGRLEDAAHYLDEALAIHREVGDRLGESVTLSDLGNLASRQDRTGDAERYYKQAVSIAHEAGYREAEARALGNLGVLAGKHWQGKRATMYLEQALAIFEAIGMTKDANMARANLTIARTQRNLQKLWPFGQHND